MCENGEEALERLRAIDLAFSERAARFAGVFPLTIVQAEPAATDDPAATDARLEERIARFVFRRSVHS